jgi:hypothetical protein
VKGGTAGVLAGGLFNIRLRGAVGGSERSSNGVPIG